MQTHNLRVLRLQLLIVYFQRVELLGMFQIGLLFGDLEFLVQILNSLEFGRRFVQTLRDGPQLNVFDELQLRGVLLRLAGQVGLKSLPLAIKLVFARGQIEKLLL